MKVSRQNLICDLVLGAMLLLVATASLVSVSYDSDDRDEAPPVTLEMKFLLQSPRASSDLRTHAVAVSPAFLRNGYPKTRVAAVRYISLQSEKGHSQLLVPLLC